jgi:hypothetical protein
MRGRNCMCVYVHRHTSTAGFEPLFYLRLSLFPRSIGFSGNEHRHFLGFSVLELLRPMTHCNSTFCFVCFIQL